MKIFLMLLLVLGGAYGGLVYNIKQNQKESLSWFEKMSDKYQHYEHIKDFEKNEIYIWKQKLNKNQEVFGKGYDFITAKEDYTLEFIPAKYINFYNQFDTNKLEDFLEKIKPSDELEQAILRDLKDIDYYDEKMLELNAAHELFTYYKFNFILLKKKNDEQGALVYVNKMINVLNQYTTHSVNLINAMKIVAMKKHLAMVYLLEGKNDLIFQSINMPTKLDLKKAKEVEMFRSLYNLIPAHKKSIHCHKYLWDFNETIKYVHEKVKIANKEHDLLKKDLNTKRIELPITPKWKKLIYNQCGYLMQETAIPNFFKYSQNWIAAHQFFKSMNHIELPSE